jgi:hypothetical protein
LRDVACGPSVETGASVPGYSGGLAAAWWILSRRLRDVPRAPIR